jgi:hypothetical protein
VSCGELALLPLPTEGEARVVAAPERGFDLGAGKGRSVEVRVPGGEVGLIVDARGRRPFVVPAAAAERIAALRAWNRALRTYPKDV